jgi:hypothetical protein
MPLLSTRTQLCVCATIVAGSVTTHNTARSGVHSALIDADGDPTYVCIGNFLYVAAE